MGSGGRIFESYVIPSGDYSKYIKYGKKELVFALNDERFLNLKNCNNKFKKHFGFTLEFTKVPISENPFVYNYQHKVIIHNKQKLMLFRIKYGL
jgi:hypothetical protein